MIIFSFLSCCYHCFPQGRMALDIDLRGNVIPSKGTDGHSVMISYVSEKTFCSKHDAISHMHVCMLHTFVSLLACFELSFPTTVVPVC